jgi:hypothetical protein
MLAFDNDGDVYALTPTYSRALTVPPTKGPACTLKATAIRAKGAEQGTVKLRLIMDALGVAAKPNASGRCRGVPRDERTREQKSLMAGAEAMASNCEHVANGFVDREEPLGPVRPI